MSRHDVKASEPVAIGQLVTILLGVVVAAGWANLSDTTILAIGSGVAALVALATTVLARARVTPLAGGWAQQTQVVIEKAVTDAVTAQLTKVVNPPAPKAPTAQFPTSPGPQMPSAPNATGTAMPPPPPKY